MEYNSCYQLWIRGYKLMAFGAPNKNLDNSLHVISLDHEKFYEGLQRQLVEAVSSMTPSQKLALLVLLGLSLLAEEQQESVPNAGQDEQSLVWSYLSQLQKELPEGKALRDLLREANIQLVVNGKPLDEAVSNDNDLDDPFEGFKRGWDDAMSGRTMSFEEFECRMLEDAD